MNMVEDTWKIISNGFETYKKNFNISIPFVINFFIGAIFLVAFFTIGIIYIFGSSLSMLENATSPEEFFSAILPLISQHVVEIVIIFVVFVIIISFFESFFTAGAIGMANQAIETGRSEISTMVEAGKKNVINLFLAEILIGLLVFAGIIFLVPGAMKVDFNEIFSPENTNAVVLMMGGLLLWILYALIINLVLSVYRYILVIETMGPLDGITAGFRFFREHMSQVFILWLVVAGIIFAFAIIGQVLGRIPIIEFVWALVNMMINILVIPPLITLWWVRLYMSRADKKIYFDELLAHPDDLSKP